MYQVQDCPSSEWCQSKFSLPDICILELYAMLCKEMNDSLQAFSYVVNSEHFAMHGEPRFIICAK